MRKILLASTALVAVAGISAASAEISLSGSADFSYTSISDDVTDNATAGENGTQWVLTTHLSSFLFNNNRHRSCNFCSL